jgi:hypothetical protein
MKRAHQLIAPTSARSVSKHRAFFCAMLGFLMLPFMPVQFTSVLTAVVWTFSGVQYALVFTALGTFRLDSVPIYSGIQNMVRLVVPESVLPYSQSITILFMFTANLSTAFFFKKVLRSKLVNRIRFD